MLRRNARPLKDLLMYSAVLLSLNVFFNMRLEAQCDVGIQVLPESFEVTVKTPQLGSTYTWVADGGQSGSGTTFFVPRTTSLLTIFQDGALATQLTFETETECHGEAGDFTYSAQASCQSCTYKFTPLNANGLSYLWLFGDGTTSTEMMPLHTYTVSGVYSVTLVITYATPGGGISTSACTKTLTAVCGTSSPVAERVECCRLYLRLCGDGQSDCNHLWEILNAGNQVALSSTEPSPEFVLSHINTYNNNILTIRHTTVCNGETSVTTFPYQIQSRGIFVGDPSLPVTSVALYSNATSLLNNNQPLFTSNTITDQNIYIQNILEINVPSVTFDHTRVCFANDAGIDVAVGCTFNVKVANRLYNGCTYAWRGIVTRGRLDMNGNPPSGGPGFENEIRGAVFAVRPQGSQANVTLVRNNFHQNFISLYADQSFSFYIQNNRFVSGSLPPLGITSIAGVEGESGGYSQTGPFAGIFIRDISFDNSYVNFFVGMTNGYYLLNTNSTISNSDFNNANVNYAYTTGRTGHGIYFRHSGGVGRLAATYNRFSTTNTAVRAISAQIGTQVSITNNTAGNVRYGFILEQRAAGRFNNSHVSFNKNNHGIDCRIVGVGFLCEPGASQNSNVDIFDNKITVTTSVGKGIFLEGPGNGNIQVRQNKITLTHHPGGRAGIHLLNFRSAQIKENEIDIRNISHPKGIWLENSSNNTVDANTITYYQQPAWQVHGIQLDNSPSNLISNNHVHNCGAALVFNGDCSSPHRIRCNHFYNSLYGLHYTEIAITGPQYNTGNRWESPEYAPGGGLIGARHDGDISIIEASRYKTSGSPPEHPQTFELNAGVSPSHWFLPGQAASCGEAFSPVISESEEMAAGAGIPMNNGFEAGYNWISRRFLYRKLRENPGLVPSDGVIQAFYQNAPNTQVGTYDAIGEQLLTLPSLSALQEQQLGGYLNDAEDAAIIMAVKNAALEDENLTEVQRQVLQDDFAAAAMDYAITCTHINTLLAPWNSDLAAALNSIAMQNAALTANQPWEVREKALRALWLGKVREGQWLTGADWEYIRETAEMCPWEGGLGVYYARALWQRLSDEPLTPSDCEGTYRHKENTTAMGETSFFVAYPNPARDHLILDLPAEWTLEGEAHYQLFDALGVLIQEGRIPPSVRMEVISLSGISTGLYICQIRRGNKVLATTKLSVVKN